MKGGCIFEEKKQKGGCGCQTGGAFTPVAQAKAAVWRSEVKAVKDETGVSYKEALTIASARRKAAPGYQSVKEKYVAKLDARRKDPTKAYKPSGKKNKRPVTFEAAENILLRYYRDRAAQYKRGPLAALRKNIASCPKKHPEKVLTACKSGPKGVPIVTPECAKSWKFRPGKSAKFATGPVAYKIRGLNDLCGEENKPARKGSKLYNMKFMLKAKRLGTPRKP
uniref:Uncharacterized protein n=1 Tax=viral metagenome TaxID=1070528 RepID=A0A6C0BJU2_9ZZZZ